MSLSLRRRILLTVTPLLLLIVILGGTGSVLLMRLGQRSDAILRDNYDSVRAMNQLHDDVTQIQASFQLAFAGRESDVRSLYKTHRDRFLHQLKIEENNITIYPEEPKLVSELTALSAIYVARGDRFFADTTSESQRKELNQGTSDQPGLPETYNQITRVALEIHDLNERQMQKSSRDAQKTARQSAVWFGVGVGASILVALASVWWLQRIIVVPIRAVTAAASAIGGGQLQLLVPVDRHDEIGHLAEAFNVMTQRLRAFRQTNTERLVRARQTAQAAIDSFPDPIVVIDIDSRVEIANPAAHRLLGVQPPREGEPLPIWTPPESLRKPVEEAIHQRQVVETDSFEKAVIFRIQGEERAFFPQVRPIWTSEKELLGAAVVLYDVTRFRILDRLKSDWVATVSHELKTPLTTVRLAVHVLLEEVVGPLEPKQVELLIEARDGTERLLKLIEYLLSLAKLEHGREEIHIQAMDPASLLRATADSIAMRVEDRRIKVVVDAAPDLPMIGIDPTKIGRALDNLLDNAITYTEPGGTITLSAAVAADGRVRISVSDTGIGIPAEYVPHVFDRFFRVPGREKNPGTGLGLAIVREIVHAHHGEITCESTPGKGTTFHLLLPVKESLS